MKTQEKKYYSMSIVLLGDFQPAMFHPRWFFDNEIITEAEYNHIINNDSNQMISSNAITQFETDDLSFSVEQKRLQIIGKKEPFEKCIDAFKRMFDSLTAIPIQAYGMNYFFHLKASKEEMEFFGKRLAPRQFWSSVFDENGDDPKNGLVSMTMRAVKTFGLLNVKVESSNRIAGVYFDYNFHNVQENNEPFSVSDIIDGIDDQEELFSNLVNDMTNSIVEKVLSDETVY